MGEIASIGLDITAVLMVIGCAAAAAKKGFLRTVVQMIAYVAIVLVASVVSRAAAPVIYDRFVEPMWMQNSQQEQMPVQPAKVNAALVSVSRAPAGMLSVQNGLPDLLDSIQDFLPDQFDPQEMADDFISDLADAALRPMMVNAIGMIGFAVTFMILSLIANTLLSTLGFINYLPVIGTINSLMGGVVGVLQGMLLVWMLGILLQGILYLNPNGWWIFSGDVIENSFLFHYFTQPQLVTDWMKSF